MRLVYDGAEDGYADAPGFCKDCGDEIAQGQTLCRRCEDMRTVAELVADGELDPKCPQCAEAISALEAGQPWPHGPRHKPSPRCQSGKHPHCTCDTCF